MREASYILLILLFVSCRSEQKQYLFVGHGYQWGISNRMDFRLEKIQYADYDQVWLGGDLCAETMEDSTTLLYLDSLLQLSAPDRHWCLGNHDSRHGRLDRIAAATGRRSFYTANVDDVCLMVWNTNFNHFQVPTPGDDCPEMEAQWRMIRSVCDTIRKCKKLVILHHHALLNDHLAGAALDLGRVFNFYRDSLLMRCQPAGWFEGDVYPMLQKVQKRGIQVVLIGGDLGQRAKRFQFRTPEGIWFLGSGVNNTCSRDSPPEYVTNFQPDSLLILRNEAWTGRLTWEFVALDKLAGVVYDSY